MLSLDWEGTWAGKVWVKRAGNSLWGTFRCGVVRGWLSEAKRPYKFPILLLSGRTWQHNWASKSDLHTTGIACLLWDILWHQIGKRWCERIRDGTWTFRQTQPNQSIRWSKSSENTWAMSLPTSSLISTKLGNCESPETMKCSWLFYGCDMFWPGYHGRLDKPHWALPCDERTVSS